MRKKVLYNMVSGFSAAMTKQKTAGGGAYKGFTVGKIKQLYFDTINAGRTRLQKCIHVYKLQNA